MEVGDAIIKGWRYKVISKEKINPGVLGGWKDNPDLIKVCDGSLDSDSEWWIILFKKGAPKELVGKKAKCLVKDYTLNLSGEHIPFFRFYKIIE